MATGPKRSAEQREADLPELARMYLTRRRQQDMAVHFKVSQQQISLDIKELHKRWLASGVMDVNERKIVELERIDFLEEEAWAAYWRTVGEKRRMAKKTSAAGNDDTELEDGEPAIETTETTWEDAGDDRFLGRVAWCIQKRCDILGLDAPKRSEITGREMPSEDVMRAEVLKAMSTPHGANGHAAQNRN